MTMDEKLDLILKQLGEMNGRIGSLENKMDMMDTQMKENGEMLKALIHRTDELSAGQVAQGEQVNYIVGEVTAIKDKLNDLTGEVEKVDKKTDAYVVDVIRLKSRI